MTSEHLGWLSCVICLIFTLRCALIFAKSNINVFLALVIYAAQWGVLIVYYSTLLNDDHSIGCRRLPEFLPAISGYLCAVVGSIIYRDQNEKAMKHVVDRERVLAFLLLFIVLPEGIEVFNLHVYGINHEDIEVFVTLILKFVGFYSLFLAAKSSTSSKSRIVIIATILSTYWLLEACYTGMWLYNKHILHSDKSTMNYFFLYGFSIVKLCAATTFIPTVLTHCHNYKKLSAYQKIMHFLHLEGSEDQHAA